MKNAFMFLLCLFTTIAFGSYAHASYLTIPAAAGASQYTWDHCVPYSGGTISDGGSGCLLYFAIPIEAGKTLSSVNVYYYDNSGSQSMSATLERSTLSSSSYSALDSASDTSTSSSIQYLTLSYGSKTSSSYAYYVKIVLYNGTQLRGIKVYYY
ncbi:MAG: hypothetical protein HY541_01220 [Deltaproteobacteria bacterium]|nr:hypothetical protein [Deltaproteobacteria bacterium]